MKTEDEFLNFHYIGNWNPSQKDHIKISQFTKFEVLSLDCNHVERFKKKKKKRGKIRDRVKHRGKIDFVWVLGKTI